MLNLHRMKLSHTIVGEKEVKELKYEIRKWWQKQARSQMLPSN